MAWQGSACVASLSWSASSAVESVALPPFLILSSPGGDPINVLLLRAKTTQFQGQIGQADAFQLELRRMRENLLQYHLVIVQGGMTLEKGDSSIAAYSGTAFSGASQKMGKAASRPLRLMTNTSLRVLP